LSYRLFPSCCRRSPYTNGAAAGYSLPVIRLPEPTGPYPVGVVDHELVDQAQGFDPQAGLRAVDKHLRAFFDLHLRGVDTHMFGAASRETDVRWLSK
jgi:hypothetical protein